MADNKREDNKREDNKRKAEKRSMDGIRLIAVDMDGTCVDNHRLVPDKNLWALEEACRAGITVVPTTGRALKGYPVAIRRMQKIRYVISSNGARVTDLKTGQDVKKVLLSGSEAAAFLHQLRKLPVWTAVHMERNCIDNNLLPFIHRKLFYHGDFKESRWIPRLERYLAARKTGVEKLQIFFLSRRARRKTLELLKQWPQFSCALSHPYYVEITAVGASKGEALETLCSRLNISAEQVMAIGDSDNDLSMLRYAGHPVAMGNAEAAVKEAAAEITAKNTQCGVARAVMEAVRGEKLI